MAIADALIPTEKMISELEYKAIRTLDKEEREFLMAVARRLGMLETYSKMD